MSGRGEVRRYWDSTCFLSILNGEEEAGVCEGILAAARAGETTIVVSPLSRLEVIRRKGSPAPVPAKQRDTIRQWFESDDLRCPEIGQEVGATAQQYCWDLNVHPRDAIHIAVAVRARCDVLETLSPSLLKWDGKVPDSAIRIRRPGPAPTRTLVEDGAERGRMSEPDCLVDLANAVREKNVVDAKVARLLDRPALPGHFGEFVAAQVFDIKLHPGAAHPGSDGVFLCGELEGKSVNIKYYTKHDRLLDMKKEGEAGPNYYLVMTGPEEEAGSSQGKVRPWVIESVFVFDARKLVGELKALNPKKRIGVAAYVPVDLWPKAMVYPQARSQLLTVTNAQRERLALFAAAAIG